MIMTLFNTNFFRTYIDRKYRNTTNVGFSIAVPFLKECFLMAMSLFVTMFLLTFFQVFYMSVVLYLCMVIVKNNSQNLLSVDCRPTVGRLSADCRPTVGQLLANSRPTVDRQSADRRPTVGRQTADSRPTVCAILVPG